ncbi:hypothetical protein, partial [Pseudomonas azotoformans]
AQRPQEKRERCALQRGASPLATKARSRQKPTHHKGIGVLGFPAQALLYPFICPDTGALVTPRPRADPHKKVRTRPFGTHRHGLIKNAFFETAVPPVPLGTDKVLEWLDLSLMK